MAQLQGAAAAGNAGGVEPDSHPSRWLSLVRRLMEASAEELGAVAKVVDVPKLLRETKPEAYAPQHFAIGPYHYQRPELKDMERYKLAAVKRTVEKFDGGLKFDDLVNKFLGRQQMIRVLYHRFLELQEQTLAWMMAIDTCFLLEFMENYHLREATDMVSSTANWINLVVRDTMMLENQIPLFLFVGPLQLRHGSDEVAADADMRAILDRFIRDVCPIKTVDVEFLSVEIAAKNAHLLELLYNFLVPASKFSAEDAELAPPAPEEVISIDPLEKQVPNYGKVKQACMQVSRLDIAPVRFINRNLSALLSLSARIMSKVPLLAALMETLGKLMASTDLEARIKGVNMGSISNSPLVQEIKIPSVEQLASCGVRLVPAPEGIAGIAFDAATATLTLPIICLDGNTDVILRNLVAYETAAVRGPLVMARYTELMNGIIDTAKDVKILRECMIVFNGMKSDKEAADMWNGMCRAVRPSKVPQMDKVIKDVNAYRDSRLSVKAKKLIKRYVFKSWKILTLLATLVLLLMTALQTFCSAYDCKSWFGGILQQVPQLPATPGGKQ
ncbi:unnamed protein product [Alopecurus aequalis]